MSNAEDGSVFWTENPLALIHEGCGLSLTSRLNSATRAVLFLWLILLGWKAQYANLFLVIALVTIVIVYYVYKNKRSESFTYPLDKWTEIPPPGKLQINDPNQYRFCLDQRPIRMDQSYVSANQALVDGFQRSNPSAQSRESYGGPLSSAMNGKPLPGNPKINVPPLLVPAATDWSYWSTTKTPPSYVNAQGAQELVQSGYVTQSPCNSQAVQFERLPPPPQVPSVYDEVMSRAYANSAPPSGPRAYDNSGCSRPKTIGQFRSEGYADLSKVSMNPGPEQIGPMYNPQALRHGVPPNVPVGPCQLTSPYDEYNRNLFTVPIDTNMYVQTEAVQPSIAGIGIGSTPQFNQMRGQYDRDGSLLFVGKDPRTPKPQPLPPRTTARPDNVTDPRSTGYGASNRSYVDPMSGQVRYYYDDVDAIRMPNMITRSKIDAFQWAPTYGPMSEDSIMSVDHARQLAETAFRDNALQNRAEYQERYMRKYNNEVGWQRRMAPLGPKR